MPALLKMIELHIVILEAELDTGPTINKLKTIGYVIAIYTSSVVKRLKSYIPAKSASNNISRLLTNTAHAV